MDKLSFEEIALAELFNRNARPFFLSVTYESDGTYRALAGPLIQKQGTIIEGIDEFLKMEWLGESRQIEDEYLKRHLNSGGILSFVASGGRLDEACKQSLLLADETGKNVYFRHNDTIHTASPNMKNTECRQLPRYYAK